MENEAEARVKALKFIEDNLGEATKGVMLDWLKKSVLNVYLQAYQQGWIDSGKAGK